MKKIVKLMAVCLVASAAVGAELPTMPVFQMRLVLDTPDGDSEQMTLITKNEHDSYTNVLNVQKTVLLDQTALKSATSHADALGQPVIEINFTENGGKRIAEVTRQNVGKRLAIVIDGKLCSAPNIHEPISGGTVQISGSFSKQEANDLVRKIGDASKRE
jgi:preprotein translocase subunit SecD